jgi:ketosteroid isomerase-like protein
MKTAGIPGVQEAPIRELIDAKAQALRSKDADAVVACYAPDNVMFTLAPPLQHTPASSPGRRGVQDWFATWDGPLQIELRPATVFVGADIAWAYQLIRMGGRKLGGEVVSMWYRETLCFRRLGGAWLIAHEHQSVPFYMDGSFRAAVDLQP